MGNCLKREIGVEEEVEQNQPTDVEEIIKKIVILFLILVNYFQ